MTTRSPFRLSSTLAGHAADVRSIASSPAGPVLFSSSRDGTARSWYQGGMQEDGKAGGLWSEGVAFTGQHDGFVNAVEWIKGDGQGSLATAGQDKLINIWPLPSSFAPSDEPLTPSNTLIGHEGNVCSLNASSDGTTLVSGSWDKTAKVWRTSDFQLDYTLEGHEQAVWAVLALDGNEKLILTGAADNLVKLWRGPKVEKTFKGHTQAVRALAKLDSSVGDGSLFASAGNDGTIRLWSLLTGESVHVLNGHDSFVYSLSPVPASAGGGLISGGEDRTMRVWRAADGECEQTIVVPAISVELYAVWTVNCLSNGDIAAGSSDGLVRIFTRDDDRVADAETLASYDKEVANTALNPSQVGDVKKNDLPGPEALDNDGKKEGQVIMVKTSSGSVEAHQWSSASRSWQKIGEVVDAVGNSRKQLYMGEEYDFVFDVDFSDGVQPLKLPYNVTDNPYETAQKFLFRHELPAEYIDQVVAHIEANTGGVALGTAGGSDFVDPYTGASRYTGGGVGSRPAAGSGSTGFSGDPYTGGGRSASAAAAKTKLLPHKTFLTFPQANLPALRAKLGQLNDQLLADPSQSTLALSASEVSALDSLIAFLVIATSTKAEKPQRLGETESAVVIKLLQWPVALQFPGLDLTRLLCQFSPLPDSIPSLLEAAQSSSGSTKEVETNTMLAFRALANLFACPAGKSLAVDEAAEILDTLKRRGLAGISKNGKIALATIALNYSIIAVQASLGATEASTLLDLITELLNDNDGEVVYRSLIALGNVLLSPQITSAIPAGSLQRYKALAKDAAKRLPEARNKAVVVEINP
ncbi:phospholipase A-2-activating protein, partial [Phenoliferia sp. Uapishka_3]